EVRSSPRKRAKAGTQALVLDSRLRGNERSFTACSAVSRSKRRNVSVSQTFFRSSPRKRGPSCQWRRLWVQGLASLARDTKTWIPAFAGMNGIQFNDAIFRE